MAVKPESRHRPAAGSASAPAGSECPIGLAITDLLPVICALRQHGTSYACGHQVRVKGWALLAATALLVAGVLFQRGVNPASLVLALYLATLLHIAVVDWEHYLIPNWVVLPAAAIGLLLFPVSPLAEGWTLGQAYLRSLAGAGLGFGVMLLIFALARGGMGGGDVKLAAFLGAILGFPYIITGLLAGFIVGGAAGVALWLMGKRGRRDILPYGPALAAGAVIHLLAGPGFYHWYLGLVR